MKALNTLTRLKIAIESNTYHSYKIQRQSLTILEIAKKKIQQLCPNDSLSYVPDQEELVVRALKEFEEYIKSGYTQKQINSIKIKTLKRVIQGVFLFPESYLKKEDFISALIACLYQKKSNSLMKLLMRNLLANWDTLQIEFTEVKNQIIKLIHTYLDQYQGQVELLRFFKSHPAFLQTGGAHLFGSYLAGVTGPSFEQKLLDLGISATGLQYQYIEHAIFGYYQELIRHASSLSDLNLQEVENLCSKTSTQVALVTISLLFRIYKTNDSLTKEKLISFALRILGDPINNHRWILNENRFAHLKPSVEHAKRVVLEEMNSEMVTLFFQTIVGDKDRKEFWKEYARKVEQIKIVSSRQYKDDLLNRKELRDKSELINARFIEAPYGPTAIVFFLPHRIIIEFSEIGNATYVYTRDSPFLKKLNQNKIYDSRQLKTPYLDQLPLNQIFLSEYKNKDFRVVHYRRWASNWQSFYSRWLKEVIGI